MIAHLIKGMLKAWSEGKKTCWQLCCCSRGWGLRRPAHTSQGSPPPPAGSPICPPSTPQATRTPPPLLHNITCIDLNPGRPSSFCADGRLLLFHFSSSFFWIASSLSSLNDFSFPARFMMNLCIFCQFILKNQFCFEHHSLSLQLFSMPIERSWIWRQCCSGVDLSKAWKPPIGGHLFGVSYPTSVC